MVPMKPVVLLSVWRVENAEIFKDTINAINDKLRLMVSLIEHYLFIPLSLTLTIFRDRSSVKRL